MSTPITFRVVGDVAALVKSASDARASLEEMVRPVPKIIDSMNGAASAVAKVQQQVQQMGGAYRAALDAEASLREAMAGSKSAADQLTGALRAKREATAQTAKVQREQSDVVEIAGRRYRKLTEEERAARRSAEEHTETVTRGASELKEFGFRVSQVSSAVRVFGIVGGPIVGRVAEALERAGVGIRGLSTTSVGAQLGVSGLLNVISTGVPILLAAVGAYAALKFAIGSVEESAKDDKNRQLLSVLRGGRAQGDLAVAQRRSQSADFGIPYEEFSKGAVALERLSKGALGAKKDLQLLEALALSTPASFATLAETIGDLNRKLIEGSTAKKAEERRDASKKELDDLVKLGVVTLETRAKVLDLQEAGKKGPAVWALVAADLERFRGNTEQVGDTFSTATTKLSNAWSGLKTVIGAPLADAITPIVETVTKGVKTLTGWVNTAVFGLQQLRRQMGDETLSRVGPSLQPQFKEFSAGAEAILPGGPAKPNPKDPPKDKEKGGKNDDMKETRELVEQLRIAQQTYNVELEKTKLLKELGQISSDQANAADRQQAQQYIARLLQIQRAIDSLITKEQAAGNERALLKLAEQAKEVERNILRARLELEKLSAGGQLRLGMRKLQNEFQDLGKSLTDLANQTITGGINTAAGALTSLITRTGDAKQAFAGYVASVIEGLIKIGLQWVAASLLKQGLDKADAASTAAKASAQTAALTPVALLQSVVSFGTAALIGLAAMAAVFAITRGFATGGYVDGPGGPTSDSVFARLSRGEFVMPARAVDFFGVENLEAMRNLQVPALGVPSLSGGAIALSRGLSPAAAGGAGVRPTSAPAMPPRITLLAVNTRQEALAAARSAQGDVVVMDSVRRQLHKLPFRRK